MAEHKAWPKATHSFKSGAHVPPNQHTSSLMSKLTSSQSGAAISPEGSSVPQPFATPGAKADNVATAKGVTPTGAPVTPATPTAAASEDAAFVALLKKKSKRGCCYRVYMCVCCVPRYFYGALQFIGACMAQLCMLGYAKFMWDCCGIPVSKLNREEYLFSKYIGQTGEITVLFHLLKMNREEQLKWLMEWEGMDVNGDDQMDKSEFLLFLQVTQESGTSSWQRDRLFMIFNKEFNGFVKFRDYLNLCFTFAPYDRERCVELSFRILSRRGDTFEMEKTCLDLTDMEHFIRDRYNKAGKKSDKWVSKKAVDLYAYIDADMSGGISYHEFREFCLGKEGKDGAKGVDGNKVFLLYGFFWQCQLRKCLFGETYWREATERRLHLFTMDQPFQEEMMSLLDWNAVCSIGLAPKGSMHARGKVDFRTEFNEAWFQAKETRFISKQKVEKREDVSLTLAAKTHSRMIKIFGRIVPDSMTVATAFATWKDVNSYVKSMAEDGGESYRLMNMSLVDLKNAAQASSINGTTRKLQVAMSLGGEFDMEATGEVAKEETKREQSQRLAKEVMVEIGKQQISDEDVICDLIYRTTGGCRDRNKSIKSGVSQGFKKGMVLPPIDRSMPSKTDSIVRNKLLLREVKNVVGSVYERKALRLSIVERFEDLERGKENDMDNWSVPSADTDTSRVDGFAGMGQIGTLAALEGIKALANMGRKSPKSGKRKSGRERGFSDFSTDSSVLPR